MEGGGATVTEGDSINLSPVDSVVLVPSLLFISMHMEDIFSWADLIS